MYTGMQMLGIPRSYFELPEDLIVVDESHEETRYAELSDVMYIACHIAPYDWEKSCPFKGHLCPSAVAKIFPNRKAQCDMRYTSHPIVRHSAFPREIRRRRSGPREDRKS